MRKSLKRYVVIFQMKCSFQEKTDDGWAVWAKNKKEVKKLANLERSRRTIKSENGAVEYIIKSIYLSKKTGH